MNPIIDFTGLVSFIDLSDLPALLSIIGLLVDVIGAITLIGFSISSIRQIGIVVQSYLHKVGFGGDYNFEGLDSALGRLSEKERLRPADDGFDDLAGFILRVSGGYWSRSGTFAGEKTAHFRPASALQKNEIWLSEDRDHVLLEIHDPSTPGIDLDPLQIGRDRLSEYIDIYAEKRFLLAGAFLIAVGFALQVVGSVIDAFGMLAGGIVGVIVFGLLGFLFMKTRL